MENFIVTTKYENLTFHDDFMFCKVLENNPDLCRELLELILGKKVGELVIAKRQRPIEILPDCRGVRFDVYAKDNEAVVYDVEMQNLKEGALERRVRYSQSMIDVENLEKGTAYGELKNSYVIYICNFNMFKTIGRHKYSFRRLCVEDPQLELGDGTELIFLCTEGEMDDVSHEMRSFLKYVSGNITEGDFANRLERAVDQARMNPRWRMEYMNLEEMIQARNREMKKRIEQLERENIEAVTRIEEIEKEKEEAKKEKEEAEKSNEELKKEKVKADLRIAELERLLSAYQEKN